MNLFHEGHKAKSLRKQRILNNTRIKQLKQLKIKMVRTRNRAWIRRNSVDHFPWTADEWLDMNS